MVIISLCLRGGRSGDGLFLTHELFIQDFRKAECIHGGWGGGGGGNNTQQ